MKIDSLGKKWPTQIACRLRTLIFRERPVIQDFLETTRQGWNWTVQILKWAKIEIFLEIQKISKILKLFNSKNFTVCRDFATTILVESRQSTRESPFWTNLNLSLFTFLCPKSQLRPEKRLKFKMLIVNFLEVTYFWIFGTFSKPLESLESRLSR